MSRSCAVYAASGQPLRAGSWVVVHRYARENTPLAASFHWRVVLIAYQTLALEAQDPDVHLQVPLTAALARRCQLIQPAPGVQLAAYPVEWRRWRAAGWDLYLTRASNGDLLLFTYKGAKSRSLDLPAHEAESLARDPIKVRAFLMEALYYHVHPGKAAALAQRHEGLSAAVLARFIRRYERQEQACAPYPVEPLYTAGIP